MPSALLAVEGLRGVIEDTMSLSLMMMQWLGESEAPNWLNRDIETLEGDCILAQIVLLPVVFECAGAIFRGRWTSSLPATFCSQAQDLIVAGISVCKGVGIP